MEQRNPATFSDDRAKKCLSGQVQIAPTPPKSQEYCQNCNYFKLGRRKHESFTFCQFTGEPTAPIFTCEFFTEAVHEQA